MSDTGPYSTAKPLFGPAPTWIGDVEEQQRIQSYALYENIYWGNPDTFKLVSRGAEDKPIYIPSGKRIVETMHRYLAPRLNVIPDPAFGTPNDQLLAQQVWTDFARRERVYSRFSANKRYGLIRGDWAFHLYADPTKPPGSKLSWMAVDPGSLFPIYNPLNVDEVIGWNIAEQFIDNEGKVRVRRLQYIKTTMMGGPSPIQVTDQVFEIDAWGGPGMSEDDAKIIEVTAPPVILPSPIDQLPVYMLPNIETPGTIFGSSEMRGLERIMAAINQSISDEELGLALDALGVYWTDAGTPQDDEGNDVPWDIGPGRVVELPDGKKFGRTEGQRSVAPYQDHLAYLDKNINDGLPAVARGDVDVQVAESGIALALEMGPIIIKAEEKELTITDVMTNMLYDLAKWYVAYEGGAFNSLVDVTRWVPTYGPKLPPNTAKDLADLVTLAGVTPQLVPTSYIRQRLRLIGFHDLPDDAAIEKAILEEQAARAKVQQDAFGAQVDGAVQSELQASGGAPDDESV